MITFTIRQYNAKTALDFYYLGHTDRAREYLSILWKFREEGEW